MITQSRNLLTFVVSAINGKQIQIKFNKEVDKDTALKVANYTYKLNNGTTGTLANDNDGVAEAGEATLTLSEDKKTVTVTSSLATETIEDILSITAEGTPFKFYVDGVKTADGKEFPKTAFDVVVKDEVAPELVKATASAAATTKTVTVEFSEPVNAATGVYKVDGKVVSATQGSKANQVVLTTDDLLYANKTYTVEVVNAKDYAGNLIKANPSTASFTVVADANAPQVTSVTATEDDTLKVVFNKSMNVGTVQSGIALLNGNGAALGGSSSTISAVAGTDNKEFEVKLASNSTVYTNADTATVNVFLKDTIKDTAGNALTSVTKQVSMSKDKVAPKVVKVEMIKDTTYTSGAFVVTFDEKVTAPASITASQFKLIDQDGVDLSTAGAAGASLYALNTPVLDSKDSKKLILPLSTNNIASTSKTATVMMAKDAVNDESLGANGNAAVTLGGVSLVATTTDKTKPVIKDLGSAGITDDIVGNATAGNPNTITFTVTEANLNKTTVLNLDNYRLDGKPLPTGSYATVATSGNDTAVTITLPTGSIANDRTGTPAIATNYAFTISSIADLSGNVMDTVAVKHVQLLDDVAPVFESVKFNTDGTATLAFSEEVTEANAGDAQSALEVKVNGQSTALTPVTDYTVTPVTSGADKGKFLLTFSAGGAIAASDVYSISVKVNAAGITDTSAKTNAATTNITKTATK